MYKKIDEATISFGVALYSIAVVGAGFSSHGSWWVGTVDEPPAGFQKQ